jgi:putative tryptophan/tyrosine transport system substrate-binding protein
VRRRELITLLGGVAAAWPLAARGQQPVRTAKVGVLHPGQAANVSMRITAIREGLSGPDTKESAVEIIVRLADGELARLPALATDLVNQRVDTIVAAGPPAVQAARGSTATIPVVAVDLESDPVASGLVASLARPGGNVTGVFLDFPDFSAKCLQLLIEAVPALTQVGVLWDPTTGPLQFSAVESAAKSLGIGLHVFEARRLADIAEAFYGLDRSRTQGALILSSPLFGGNPPRERVFRRSRYFPMLQGKAGCLPMDRTFKGFTVRLLVWRAKCCTAPSRLTCRRSGRRDSNW